MCERELGRTELQNVVINGLTFVALTLSSDLQVAASLLEPPLIHIRKPYYPCNMSDRSSNSVTADVLKLPIFDWLRDRRFILASSNPEVVNAVRQMVGLVVD